MINEKKINVKYTNSQINIDAIVSLIAKNIRREISQSQHKDSQIDTKQQQTNE